MGLFICAKCNCIENTALGWWWSKDHIRLVLPPDMKEYESGKGLCSECLPDTSKLEGGKKEHPFKYCGKWHGKFPKQNAEDFLKSEEGQHYKRNGYTLTYIN